MSEKQTQFITITKSAKILDCHPNTIRNLIRDKKLPAVRVGRIVRINLADLLALPTPYKGGEFGIWS